MKRIFIMDERTQEYVPLESLQKPKDFRYQKSVRMFQPKRM